MALPILYIVMPCYNEEAVLPESMRLVVDELQSLEDQRLVDALASRILLVDDGSTDGTWSIIESAAGEDARIRGIRLSRNRGHQNALLAGLMEARGCCDIAITIDADGQDDVRAMESMVREYLAGCEVVYGVRERRDVDSLFKRFTAQAFYKFMRAMGCEVVSNHGDYRLVSARVLDALAEYGEVNLFLRGMIPLVGFKSTSVYYDRHERLAGRSHYSVPKMFGLAAEGITSLSIRPLRIATALGIIVSVLSLVGIIWVVVTRLFGYTVDGWASLAVIMLLVAGVQLIVLGVMGEYIGRIYLETKHRPRYVVDERTGDGATAPSFARGGEPPHE